MSDSSDDSGAVGGGLAGMLKMFGDAQRKMEDMRERMDSVTVDGESGGGMVKVSCTLKGEVKSLKIAPSLLESGESAETLEDLILAGIANAQKNAAAKAEEELGKIAGSMGLPKGMGLPF